MGAILANGAHPHFIAFCRILSKRKITQYLTQNLTQFCKRNSNVNLKRQHYGFSKTKNSLRKVRRQGLVEPYHLGLEGGGVEGFADGGVEGTAMAGVNDSSIGCS